MHAEVAFDDLLEGALGRPGEAPRRNWSMPPAGTAAAYGFFFNAAPQTWAVDGRRRTRPGVFTVSPIPAGACAPAAALARGCTRTEECAGGTGRAARPARRLSSIERVALLEMNELGAGLDERFTAADLRSAFRRLARRYHPDRHSTCTEAQKTDLSRVFARLRDAYIALARSDADDSGARAVDPSRRRS